jgi:ferredoxin-NADP reductase
LESTRAKVVFTLTREKPADWRGELGRIDAAMLKRNISNMEDKHYYICGPPEMVEATQTALLELGVPDSHIRAEKWGGIPNSA